VGVEPAPADHVAARRGQRDAPAAPEHRPREEDRASDALGQRAIELARRDRPGVDVEPVALRPFRLHAERLDQLDERLDVADARDVRQRDRVLGEQRGGDDRQRRVLVARRADRAGERAPALDENWTAEEEADTGQAGRASHRGSARSEVRAGGAVRLTAIVSAGYDSPRERPRQRARRGGRRGAAGAAHVVRSAVTAAAARPGLAPRLHPAAARLAHLRSRPC
jgi:hypothetical protein